MSRRAAAEIGRVDIFGAIVELIDDGRRIGPAGSAFAYLNWGGCQGWWGVVVVVGVLARSVDARAYLGPRPGQGR